MFSALRSYAPRRTHVGFAQARRWLATETAVSPNVADEDDRAKAQRVKEYEAFLEQKANEPPLRPQLNIKVKDDHALYHFFRKMPAKDGENPVYETIETSNTHKKGTCHLMAVCNSMIDTTLVSSRPKLECD